MADRSSALLRFFFGTMGSGKSTQALQIHHNLRQGGLACLLISQLDRTHGRVSSRLGVSADAIVIDPSMDLFALVRRHHEDLDGELHAVVCDESQFYEPHQVEQLARVVDELGIEVYAFGLLTTFQGVMFPGSARLMELADVRSELQVEARCLCGARATHNARLVNGVQVYDGEMKVVGDTGGEATVTYALMCRRCWTSGRDLARQTSLFDGEARPTAPAGRIVVDLTDSGSPTDGASPFDGAGTGPDDAVVSSSG